MTLLPLELFKLLKNSLVCQHTPEDVFFFSWTCLQKNQRNILFPCWEFLRKSLIITVIVFSFSRKALWFFDTATNYKRKLPCQPAIHPTHKVTSFTIQICLLIELACASLRLIISRESIIWSIQCLVFMFSWNPFGWTFPKKQYENLIVRQSRRYFNDLWILTWIQTCKKFVSIPNLGRFQRFTVWKLVLSPMEKRDQILHETRKLLLDSHNF